MVAVGGQLGVGARRVWFVSGRLGKFMGLGRRGYGYGTKISLHEERFLVCSRGFGRLYRSRLLLAMSIHYHHLSKPTAAYVLTPI